ncbi:hypothetical protein IFM89_037257 [Coptis chinensis]|uniref:Disease resistance R13L4/SHOC-2-like LRR domain-containing protein n=1 Tax=Coptis chinensis TaxID=261450 RepID=A0A835I7T7_9MAGN|nr:hypothetical protein IFM89_037257 [Coptis chinensis]
MPHLYREDLVCISGKREPVDEDLSFLVDGIFHFARGVRTRTTEPHVHHGLEMDAKIAECLVRRNISMLTLATWRRAKLINQSAYKFQSLEAQLLTSANLLQWGNILKMVRGIEVPSQVLSYLLSPCFCFKSVVVHHDIAITEDMEISSMICKAKNLRTLLTPSIQIRVRVELYQELTCLRTVPVELYQELTCLRTLDLGGSDIDKLPNEVGRLLHLRYLNLRGTNLSELPETICNLYNLQTLDLFQCKEIQKLPSGIGKLTNLRHLGIGGTDALGYLPQGIGSLRFLRTLSKFIVRGSSMGCNLGELKLLTFLQGNLKIEGLERVVEMNEAAEAELRKKNRLRGLTLNFGVLEQAVWKR